MIYDTDVATIDTTRYPTLVIKYKDLDPTPGQIKDFLDKSDDVISNREGLFVVVIDLSDVRWFSGKALAQLGRGAKKIAKRHSPRHHSIVMVVTKPFLNLLVRGFNAISGLTNRQKVVATVEEGMVVAEKQLSV